jgi:hypothetical protein
LWIRSQDRKELVDVTGKHIYVWDKSVFIDLWEDPEADSGTVELGKYNSPERALEVLDDIQVKLHELRYDELGCMFSNGNYKMPELKEPTYKMPKE